MPEYPEIFLLRHGQTEWNVAGRHQGRLNSPLTDLGRDQAVTQGGLLYEQGLSVRGITCLCSPQGRAVETAHIAFAALGKTADQDPNLCEIAFGDYEGLTLTDIEHKFPDARLPNEKDWFEWNFTTPGGEDFEQICARVQRVLDRLSGPSVIVTHGITGRVLRGLYLGLGLNGMADLPGGQGIVFHLLNGRHSVLHPTDGTA